jgi:PadR family transcriptional regulator PadR
LLLSEWREHEKRNKRFYRLSPAGAATLEQLLVEWESINSSIHQVLSGNVLSDSIVKEA